MAPKHAPLKFAWNDHCSKHIKNEMKVIGQKQNSRHFKFAQHAPIELKFAWNDHCDTLNILKMADHRSKNDGTIMFKFAQHAPKRSNLHGMIMGDMSAKK